MAKSHFSSSQLYALRNEINVKILIEKTLAIPCGVIKGCFRFECPLCEGFDTAVNPKTNLARCFSCEKNFNTIDLTMLIRQTDFVQSVKFLLSIVQKDTTGQQPANQRVLSGSNPHQDCRLMRKPRSEKSDNHPSQIGKVLGALLAPDNDEISMKRPSKPIKATVAPETVDDDRIGALEKRLEDLGRQIQNLTQTITGSLPE